jgi:predicted nucleotidyltransferase
VNVAVPHRAVVAGLDGDVLVLLAKTTQSMSGREIAERLGLRSHDGVRKSLARLVGQGIVLREGSRSAYMHVLNREHVGAPAVLVLAGMRAELWTRIRAAMAAWSLPAVHASAFGSAARGDGDEQSDIDLFVVRSASVAEDDPGWIDQIEALRTQVETWTGNRAGIVEQDEQGLRELLARPQPPPVLRDVERDGIDLAGVPTRRLLGAFRAA